MRSLRARNAGAAEQDGSPESTFGVEVFVIQNPAAGSRPADAVRQRIESALAERRVRFQHSYTLEPGHGRELARQALSDGYRRLLVAGGDGTVTEVASALAGSEAALAVIPVGTGNQLAANLGVPRGLERSIDVAIFGGLWRIDVGRINGHPFTCMAGAGFDAAVVSPQSQVKRRLGYLAYVQAAAAAALAPKLSNFTMSLDGETIVGRGVGVEVTNMPGLIAPGLRRPIRIVPDGAPDDGRLEVCMFAAESTLQIFSALGSILMGRHGRNPHLRYFSGSEIHVEADPPLPLQADGERIGTTPFTATIEPRALTVVVPDAKPV